MPEIIISILENWNISNLVIIIITKDQHNPTNMVIIKVVASKVSLS